MVSPCALRLLLLLPLATCSPWLDREDPGGVQAGPVTWAQVAGGHRVPGGTAWRLRGLWAPALLVTARELSSREQASSGGPFMRREDDQEAPDFPPADSKKAPGPLGTLVEGLQGYGRKKGGFSFRFGRGPENPGNDSSPGGARGEGRSSSKVPDPVLDLSRY
ncbi:orexigenic neuropeptide QRFP [Sorex fumeus]|uniref:orexigenic neuropeptide QRFP n=1 Tax=Sorex fumeus TaxID=62283 RepID=UPI0024AE5A65|nr:orexigenic neuropeptide QRFP [Sorex fumeus]